MPFKNNTLWMKFFLIIPFSLLTLVAIAQGPSTVLENKVNDGNFAGGSPAALKKAAEKAAQEGDLFAAMKYYQIALTKDSSEANLLAFAHAAESVFGYDEAIGAYKTVIQRAYPQATMAEFKLAGIYFKQGRYEEAGALYDKIALSATGEQAAQAKKMADDCIWAETAQSNSDLDIKINHLGEEVNSEYSEFAPLKLADTLYFSSLKFPFESDKHKPQRLLSKVLKNVTSPTSNNTDVSVINRGQDFTAHTSLNLAGNTMYYTICSYTSAGEVDCQIYRKMRLENGNWSDAEKLNESINTPGSSTTQPNIGFDRLTNQEVLFYVSDRTGGKGERDIWSASILADGTFGQPVNLSSINTDKDDITPFYHRNTGVLYYSSNGLQSLGGYDIYRVRGNGLTWSEPDHLVAPINSSSNEIYYTLTDDGYNGYFASNRPGSLYYDTIGCCYDIYHADMYKPELVLMPFHKITGESLTGTRLILIPTKPENENRDLIVEGIEHKLNPALGETYTAIFEKEGFESDTLVFVTANDPWKELRREKLYLTPSSINLIAYSFEKASEAVLNGTTYTFEDLGLVTSEGTLATSKSTEEKFERKTLAPDLNTFSKKLEFNHRYRIYMKKDGYTVDSVLVSTEGMKKSQTIIKNLFLGRGGLILEGFAHNKFTGESLPGVTFSVFEDPNLLLDRKTNDTNNDYHSGIAFGKSYMLIAQKEGFESDTVRFTSNNYSPTEFSKITKKLYLRPAGLFPVILYYDNDEPTKRTTSRMTSKSYEKTYFDYQSRKSAFQQTSPDGGSEITDFFDNRVKEGWERLQELSTIILKELQSGSIVELEVSGFASPRANSNYNRNLTSRRIVCISNHFRQFQNGVFRPYIDKNKLRFVTVPQGEELAPQGISDIIADEKNSIYSVAASKERRAQIVRMNILAQ
jgi:tetratricopeptide (TPR) repeat protein